MYIIIILAYWIASCIAVYVIRRGRRNTSGSNTSIWEHIVLILLSPLALPIVAIVLLLHKCRNAYYTNRPRPIPKRMRKYLKQDCVLDENKTTVSLSEYNYKHGTNYSLEDVYGKKYLASLSEDTKGKIMEESASYGKLTIQENIPQTPCTTAATALGRGIVDGDFSEFEKMLSEQVVHVNYRRESISGKDEIIKYWKGWRSRYVETKKATKFEVVHSNYYSDSCLLLGSMVVLFLIKDGYVTKTLFIPRFLNRTVGHHDDMLDFPFDLNSIMPCLTKVETLSEVDDDEKKENRIPCLTCGMPSEKLGWYSSLFKAGYHGYSGFVSVCPHCQKVVEYYPSIRIRYGEPVNQEDTNFPIPHQINKKEYSPKLYGIRNFENIDPLKGTKYVADLSGKNKVAAEESDWGIIFTMGRQDLDKIKNCYLRALEDGVYEAANNLGIIYSNFEGNSEEGIKMFWKAIDGGSHHAMLNMFTVLWSDSRYQEAVDFLAQIRNYPSPSLKCLWNYAFFTFMGEDYPRNPIEEKSADKAIEILYDILGKRGNPLYNSDRDVFENTEAFMEYIYSGNIFSSKAKDYHWRIKVNSDSLMAKGRDAVFTDLDALSLDSGFHMSLRYVDYNRKDEGTYYYIHNEQNEEDKDILKYIHVEETSMGLWQLYLLMNTSKIAPAGTGYDDEKTFVLTGKELYDISPLSFYSLRDLLRQNYLYPSIDIVKSPEGITGHVFCCYWSNYEGLVREETKIRILNGKVDSYEFVGKFILYKYYGPES